MGKLSKAELQRRVEILIKNGRQAKGQVILARIGCIPEVLAEGDGLLQTWLTSEKALNLGKGHQKEATSAERDVYKTAGAEMGSLIEAIYVLFNNEGDVLTALGLPRRRTGGGRRKNGPAQPTPANGTQTTPTSAQPPAPATLTANEADQPTETTAVEKGANSNSNGNGNGNHSSSDNGSGKRSQRSRRVADDITLWQSICANVTNLSEVNQQRLQRYDWTLSRIEKLAGIVGSVGEADNTQQEKKSDYHTLVNVALRHKQTLLDWYQPIARLAGKEIRKLPPQERAQYTALFGF